MVKTKGAELRHAVNLRSGCKHRAGRERKAGGEHLEVSTTATNSADALVGSVASVRGREPARIDIRERFQGHAAKDGSASWEIWCELEGRSLGVGSGAAELEFTLLAVNGHATTGGAMLVETRASDTHD